MSKNKLDTSEQAILDDFDAGEFKSDLTTERRKMLAKAAEDTIKKDKRINIRISGRDLSALQRRALEQGIPYQTLVSSILHKYLSGNLRDITTSRDTLSNNEHRSE